MLGSGHSERGLVTKNTSLSFRLIGSSRSSSEPTRETADSISGSLSNSFSISTSISSDFSREIVGNFSN